MSIDTLLLFRVENIQHMCIFYVIPFQNMFNLGIQIVPRLIHFVYLYNAHIQIFMLTCVWDHVQTGIAYC